MDHERHPSPMRASILAAAAMLLLPACHRDPRSHASERSQRIEAAQAPDSAAGDDAGTGAGDASRRDAAAGPAPPGWSAQAEVDFGRISRLSRFASATWRIQNPRQDSHRLIGLTTSCACHRLILRRREAGTGSWVDRKLTAAELPIAIEAGEQFEVVVEIDTQRFHSRVAGRLALATDDPACPLISADLAGTVSEVFEIDPPVHDLGVVARGVARDERLDFTIRRVDGQKFQIIDLSDCPEGMFADFHAVDGDWTTWVLRASIVGIEAEGPFDERILFVADDGSHGACLVRGETPWSIRVVPAGVLYLGTIEPERPAKGTIGVEVEDPALWEGLELAWAWHEPQPDGLHASLKLARKEPRVGSVAVEWRVDRGARLPAGLCSGEVRLTHSARQMRRSVYVQGFVPETR